jgi:large subunit ribosomal protein L18
MADKNKDKQVRLQRRKYSLRSSLFGSPERPRLSVFRSDKHISAQVIDDYAGKRWRRPPAAPKCAAI